MPKTLTQKTIDTLQSVRFTSDPDTGLTYKEIRTICQRVGRGKVDYEVIARLFDRSLPVHKPGVEHLKASLIKEIATPGKKIKRFWLSEYELTPGRVKVLADFINNPSAFNISLSHLEDVSLGRWDYRNKPIYPVYEVFRIGHALANFYFILLPWQTAMYLKHPAGRVRLYL